MHRPLLPVVALLAACNPQNAVLEQGDFTAWLAATNSLTVARGDALFDDEGEPLLDPDDEGSASKAGYRSYKAIDCRPFEFARNEAEREALRLPNRELICEDDPGGSFPLTQEKWLGLNGFHVVGDALEPWRGEAIMTSEGDLQIGFHHRLPSGQDFRFAFAVSPDFQPEVCVEDPATGGAHWEVLDGDWVTEWSRGLPEGTRRYFLNANAYQFDPVLDSGETTRGRWFLPLTWRSGHAAGKFADDLFSVRSTRYGEPAAYVDADSSDLEIIAIPDEAIFHCELEEGEPGTESACMDRLVTRVDEVADDVARELTIAGIPAQGEPSARPIVEDNDWRVGDGRLAGLDGWAGLNYSWVTFDPGSELEVGGAASGEFNIFFDALDSQSRFHVRGRFSVDAIKKDTWVTDYLPAEEDLLPDSRPACEPGADDDAE